MFARYRTPPWTVYLGLAVSLGFVHAVARGQSSSPPGSSGNIELRYDAPDGCGNREQVLERVQQFLRSSPAPDVSLWAEITVETTERGLGIHYDASRQGVSSTRELIVVDCQAAIEASALLLVMTLDPVMSVEAPPEGGAAAEAPGSALNTDAPGVAALGEQIQTPEARRRTSVRRGTREPGVEEAQSRAADGTGSEFEAITLSAGGELAAGVAPRVARGIRLGLGTAAYGVGGEVTAGYAWVPQESLSQVNGAELGSHLYRLHLRLTYPFSSGRVRIAPLLGVGAEHLWARVDGITNPGSKASTWLSGVGGAQLDVLVFDALSLRLQAGVVVSMQRPRFIVRGLELVHRPDPLAAEASGGLVWSWETRLGAD